MKKFYLRTSVESEELEKGIYSWGFAGVLVLPWIKETACVFLNRTEIFQLPLFQQMNDTNQITEILNENLSTEPI